MLDFDADVNNVEDFLAELDKTEVDLSDPRWRFKQQVKELMKAHPERTRSEAEEIIETVIRTKCTDKRCACGEVAQHFDPKQKSDIYCGKCWFKKTGSYE